MRPGSGTTKRAAAAATLTLIVGLLLALPASARDESMRIENVSYSRPLVVVNPGDRVLWVHNDGGTPHTVTADNGAFDSSPRTQGGSCNLIGDDCMYQTRNSQFEEVFDTIGRFAYHCKIHPSMTGEVRVVRRGAASPSPTPTSPSPTPTGTSPSPSPTGSPTGTVSPTGTASPTGTGTPSPTVSPTERPDDGGTSAGRVAVAGVGVAALAGVGLLVYRRFLSG